jgi:hypothetical protein
VGPLAELVNRRENGQSGTQSTLRPQPR